MGLSKGNCLAQAQSPHWTDTGAAPAQRAPTLGLRLRVANPGRLWLNGPPVPPAGSTRAGTVPYGMEQGGAHVVGVLGRTLACVSPQHDDTVTVTRIANSGSASSGDSARWREGGREGGREGRTDNIGTT